MNVAAKVSLKIQLSQKIYYEVTDVDQCSEVANIVFIKMYGENSSQKMLKISLKSFLNRIQQDV